MMTDLDQKIMNDPYYKDVLQYYGSLDAVQSAGFFDDGIAPETLKNLSDPRWLTTSLAKVKAHLVRQPESARNPVVLLTTGGFAPLHEGHLKMMEVARQKMTVEGYAVIGGFFAPAHDSYVSSKGNGAELFPAHARLDMLYKALSSSDWLSVDPWMALYMPGDLNFTDVIARLENYLNTHLETPEPVKVVYVFGSDNAYFARTFLKKGMCVCVARPGFEENLLEIQSDPALVASSRLFFAHSNIKLSSTEIRMDNVQPHRRLDDPESFLGGVDEKRMTYFIRNDLDWALKPWETLCCSELLKSAGNGFVARLKNDIETSVMKSSLSSFPRQVDVHLVSVPEQKSWLEKNLKNKPFINMDWVTEGCGYPAHFSRLFILSDVQVSSLDLVPRPGSLSSEELFSKLPMGNYFLVDDDIATGFSMGKLETFLSEKIKIKGHISLLQQWFQEKFADTPYHPWDIVDARDFLLGSHHSGLVVQDFNHNIRRVPYILPYVSLASRAAIPHDQQKSFTEAILKSNLQFFRELDHQVLLSDTDSAFKSLMVEIGFDTKMSMVSLCEWHLEKLTVDQ